MLASLGNRAGPRQPPCSSAPPTYSPSTRNDAGGLAAPRNVGLRLAGLWGSTALWSGRFPAAPLGEPIRPRHHEFGRKDTHLLFANSIPLRGIDPPTNSRLVMMTSFNWLREELMEFRSRYRRETSIHKPLVWKLLESRLSSICPHISAMSNQCISYD